MAARLGVEVQPGDENLAPEELSSTMVARAQQAGKTQEEIAEALQEV